jgi:hypothetical protein
MACARCRKHVLRRFGVVEVFTPGTPTARIVEFIRERVGETPASS